MGNEHPSSDRLWFWFGVTSLLFLVLLAISPLKDYFSEYRHYQNQYRQLLLAKAGSRKDLRAAQALQVGIRQIWIPGFEGRVDRCVTCHLGVDNAALRQAPEPFRFHPTTPHTPGDVDRFGCVVCHRGQGRATTVAEAHGQVPDWQSPLLPLTYTEASCGVCHRQDQVPEAPLLSQGRQLMEKAGCYGCHKLEGHEDWKASAPDLGGLSLKTTPEWLKQWLRKPASLRARTWMPDFHLSAEEVDSLVAFLWVQPAPHSLTVPSDDSLPAGDYDRGKKLFRESRCISCHTVEGRGNGSAAELSGIGSKVKRGWLVAFLGNPHGFQPRTLMPHFDFTRQDLLDLSQYMMEEFVNPSAPKPGGGFRPEPKRIKAGGKLYRKFGCGGCHQLAGYEQTVKIGPELTGIGDKPVENLDFGRRDDLPRRLPDWLAAKVTQPRSFREGLKMPVFNFTEEQVEAIVTALLSRTGERVPESYRVPVSRPSYQPPGRFGRLVKRYRCLSCHQIEGVGGDISKAPLTYEGSKVKKQWLQQYLLVPTTIRPLLTDRMLPLRMSREEAGFLADFMENVYLDNDIPEELFPSGPPPQKVERGRQLFYQRYGCQSCHMVHNKGGFYGPLLDGLGDRLKSGWVAWWLRGPQRWRQDVRCPDFGMDEEDATDLAAFIADISGGRPAGRASAGKGGGE